MFVRIDNTPRDYAWGADGAIGAFRGRPATGRPEAELWLGAHPGSPARLVDAGTTGPSDLAEWIAADPERVLGAATVRDYADEGRPRLPFLMKVLAAAAPLSLQAHPTREQAMAGFALEQAEGVPLDSYERSYKDRFHKPELIVAVSERFEALSGFRPAVEVTGILDVLVQADAASSEPAPSAIASLSERLTAGGLAETVAWLLREGRSSHDGCVERLVEHVTDLAVSEVAAASPYAASFATVGDLAAAYPGDPGLVISLLLNRVTLRRGESLSLAAGNIHAYLGGVGIEVMAASDNVLRGGLTPKHVDVDELAAVLDFTPMPPPRLEPERPTPGIRTYRPGVPDFVLHRLEASLDDRAPRVELDGPAIVLAEGDPVRLTGASGSIELGRGDAAYVTPDERELSGGGPGIAWIASVGRRPTPTEP
ncbi:mannose-6-phosphate isomerase, class I [Agromyces mediolanus]|uniref:mannose-6-phosphate isomerase, class I n=1 Tax=Agromyces mediolanus TaxID=41986 RepID=UPI00203D402C|nr:mannose-6-phosphate isomerase, class I [Agromyces mediolanus]MCM3658176.1 mannose-6-phosphate isomerase, class I [Agromyces mediolanus]